MPLGEHQLFRIESQSGSRVLSPLTDRLLFLIVKGTRPLYLLFWVLTRRQAIHVFDRQEERFDSFSTVRTIDAR